MKNRFKSMISLIVSVALLTLTIQIVPLQAEEDPINENYDEGSVIVVTKEEAVVVEVDHDEDIEEVIEKYEEDPDVLYAQKNYIYELMEDTYSNDTMFTEQWHLSGSSGFVRAWKYGKTNKQIKVAVIDTGVNMNHEDLKGVINKEASYDFVNETDEVVDVQGHGTHVAGIVAAETNNNLGVSGVSYNAELLIYQVFYKNATGSYITNSFYTLQAYNKAINDGARVINMSLGGYGENNYDYLLEDAINQAQAKGIVTVCAGGNGDNGVPSTEKIFPGDLEACISVTGTDENDVRNNSYDYNEYKDIAAPGVRIFSTLRSGDYGTNSGTSMASPAVAGTIALMLSVNPGLSVGEVKEILYNTAIDLGAKGRDDYYGHGLVNAEAALKKTWESVHGPTITPVDTINLSVKNVTLTVGESKSLTATILPTDATDKTISWSSSNQNIAAIDSAGKITAKAAGNATITAKSTNGKTDTCAITVKSPTVEITGIGLDKTSITVNRGNSVAITASIYPSNTTKDKTISWKSSNTKVATINSTGTVKAVEKGTATITATSSNGKTANCQISVVLPTLFSDVKEGDWYYDSIDFVNTKGVMTGLNTKTFGVSDDMTREQFALVLYRMEGKPGVTYSNKFSDVSPGLWYTDAVIWASNCGIVTGYDNGKYGTGDGITREQMATMMVRYANYKKFTVGNKKTYNSFPDYKRVSAFADDAMKWAYGNGIITGDNGRINPQGNAVRAVAATILMRFMKLYSM